MGAAGFAGACTFRLEDRFADLLGSLSVPAMLTPPLDEDDHVAGPYNAPLELVMYGDFQCPYCSAAQSIVRRVRERLDGRLRYVFRHLPLTEVREQFGVPQGAARHW